MKKFLANVLILSSLLLLIESCSTVHRQGYRKDYSTDYPFVPIFGPKFEKALYSAKISFGDDIFTSLAIIKFVPETNSYRLAFLSESGIRLFEMEFLKNGETEVHYISDFLNKKALVNKLLSDFALLFPIENKENIKKVLSMKADTSSYLIRMKENGIKDYYFTSTMEGPEKIYEHGFVYGRTSVFLNQYKNNSPAEIKFTHRMLNFQISLNQIDYTEWN